MEHANPEKGCAERPPKNNNPGQFTMSQSLSQIYLHVVFSTKERRPFLLELSARQAMHKCLAKISNELDSLVEVPGLSGCAGQPWAALHNPYRG
jgi:hypothetical protein